MIIDAGSGPLRILLTGGRSPVALELARLLRAAGHLVYAAESAPYHLCRVSSAIERSFALPSPIDDLDGFSRTLREIASEYAIDALIPTCEEIFHVSRELQRFEGVCRVLAPPLDQLERLHHKGKFIREAERAGLRVPATELVESPDSWLRLLDDPRFAQGIVLKPAYSRFASRTLAFDLRRRSLSEKDRRETIRKLAEAHASPGSPWIAQELLRGEEWCTYSVAHGGTLVAHAAYRSRFRAGRGASIHYEPADQPRLLAWVSRFVQQSGFTGQIAFDFMISPEGIAMPIECNPRATSGILLFGAEDRLAEAMLSPARILAEGTIVAPSATSGETGRGAMLSLAMLSYGLGQAVRRRMLREWLRAYRNGRDAVYRRDDPGPFAEQLRLLAWTWRVARRRGITMQEASTSDIEWNGER